MVRSRISAWHTKSPASSPSQPNGLHLAQVLGSSWRIQPAELEKSKGSGLSSCQDFRNLCQTIMMRALNVTISDLEFNRLGIPKETLTFTELVDIIGGELIRQNMDMCVELAEKYGLSSLTMDEINNEVKAARNAQGDR
jgi:hypothetical protein